jgi:glycosyltransferase involved in cell wall biosynthesis
VTDLLIAGHGIEPGRITTCEAFVDVDAIAPISRSEARARLGVPTEALVVGSVGLADWRKDPEHLLRAMAPRARLEEEAPWIVWIGGDPGSVDGRHLDDEARRLGLADRFRHVPHVEDPTALLHGLDVFALPAREDAMPLAALEAAAAGLPIVCFRAGGIAGLCDRGAGIAVNYPDTAAFADAIGHLLAHDEQRAEMGAAGRALVTAGNDIGPAVEQISRVIEGALRRGPGEP